ncbi:unnamed protein product [Scytosiphon promiscuus]
MDSASGIGTKNFVAIKSAQKFLGLARDDDDPLEESIRCIPFDYAKSDILTGHLTGILERFRSDNRYRNDERYLKLWMRYADLTDDANKVFLTLKYEEIGTQLALFWAAWAYVLEMADSYNAAAERISEGQRKGALPVVLLENFLRAFQQRMLERVEAHHSISRGASGTIEEDVVVDHSPRSVQCAPLCQSGSPQIGMNKSKKSTDRRVLAAVETEHMSGKGGDLAGLRACTSGVEICESKVGLRVRDANSCGQAAPRAKGYTPGTLTSPLEASVVTDNLIRDPFSPDKRRRLTTNTTQYLRWASSSRKVYDFRQGARQAGRRAIDSWPSKMALVNARSRQPVGMTKTLGTQRLDITGMLGKGSFARVFSCKTSEDQRQVAIKIEHEDVAPSLPWECFIVLQLSERLFRERKRQNGSALLPPISVVQPEALFLYRDGCAMMMPQCASGTLHDLVALYAKRSRTMPQLVVMHYAVKMLRFCRAMHSMSILHMDIKPDNWLLTGGAESEWNCGNDGHSLSLIDFGKAIDLSVFPQNGSGMAFVGQCCAPSFSCPAMTEGSPWKYDADLYALGSCIYFMLHGVYLEVFREQDPNSSLGSRWRPLRKCKRYWEVDIWDNLFNELLNSGLRATGVAGPDTVFGQLEESLTSYLRVYQRSRELKECLRRQDNMSSDR